MKLLVPLLMGALLLTAGIDLHAAVPVSHPGYPAFRKKIPPLPPAALQYLRHLTPAAYRHATGKKMHAGNRIALRLYQWGLMKKIPEHGYITERQRKLARWSLILGAGSFLITVIPVIGLLGIPAAIGGIVLGIMSLKGNSNTNGILGIVFGGAYLLLLVLVVALLLLLFSGFK